MQLTLEEAATRLGKSVRQLRYMITNGRLQARKMAGRWVVESADLPLSDGQRRAVDRRERQLRAAVDQGLGLGDERARPQRYSVRDLKAFQITLALLEKAQASVGEDHQAARYLRRTLEQLARGCHRFERTGKADAYREARDLASLAVCELVIAGSPDADALVTAIEQDLMAALAGLLRRLEQRRPR